MWHFAQLGLVEVAYQLRRINHHVKVFAAVRKEAYARLPQTTVMAQQYRGSAIDIAYSAPEPARDLRQQRPPGEERTGWPGRSGGGRTRSKRSWGGPRSPTRTRARRKTASTYICRHTLLRPRDLMTMGEHLAALRPDERGSEHRLKEVVHQAAAEIAYEYLAEIAPHIGDLDLDRLLRRLPGHVLTRDEVETLFREHGVADGGDDKHVFCALYRVGLLGYVHHDRMRGEWAQRFLRPGEATLDPDGVLPPATHYLLHPVLSDVIGRLNPAYLQRIDRVNIVGYGRPWREVGQRRAPDPRAHLLRAQR